MTKVLRKEIMRRSNLEKLYYKSKSEEDKNKYKKHKNYCNRLYKKGKKEIFE